MRENVRLEFKAWLLYSAVFMLASVCTAWLFYDSVYPVFFFAPFFAIFIRKVKENEKKRKREELAAQFLRALVSVSTSLSAGISAENAFAGAFGEMLCLYGKRSAIAKELATVNSRVAVGKSLTDALFELAKRVGIPEIYDFAVVFSVAKERGADLSAVISSCTKIMESKKRAEEDAKVLIRAKQYEQRVMCIIPPGILLYLRLTSQGFMEVLYHNLSGITIMSICLAVYVVAIMISEKIGDVSV